MKFNHRHVLSMEQFSAADIHAVLDTAENFLELNSREIKKVPTLRGRAVINFFFEPSTRTRTSFEIAGKRLSADMLNLSGSSSSVVKGESLVDTALTLRSMNPDIVVVRHSHAGAPHLMARHVGAHVINAGDGQHQHPTQGLLDLMTVRQRFGQIEGLKVAIVGDILHSRVARSDLIGFQKCGAEVWLCGPPTLLPPEFARFGARMTYNLEEALTGAHVIILLRVQAERMNSAFFPTAREYSQRYGLNSEKLKWARKDAVVMHPGPMNRGVEIDPSVADGAHSLILRQVENGVSVRAALMMMLLGGGDRPRGDA
ncbi:MAG: Aspartate carbamoyltransferase [Myxococcota bacterium]|nr:Aspartate carbamoyltransferase [Myxococcota bacterium]